LINSLIMFLKKLNISEITIDYESEVNDIFDDNKRNLLKISLLLVIIEKFF